MTFQQRRMIITAVAAVLAVAVLTRKPVSTPSPARLTSGSGGLVAMWLGVVAGALIVVGVVSQTLLRHFIQIAPLVMALGLLAWRSAWGVSAAAPLFTFWFLIMGRFGCSPGLKLVMASDAVAGAHGRNADELVERVRQGRQAPMSAVISATSLAAESLGLEKTTGRISQGYQADIIAVDGDPATDIRALTRVIFVMRDGKLRPFCSGGRISTGIEFRRFSIPRRTGELVHERTARLLAVEFSPG